MDNNNKYFQNYPSCKSKIRNNKKKKSLVTKKYRRFQNYSKTPSFQRKKARTNGQNISNISFNEGDFVASTQYRSNLKPRYRTLSEPYSNARLDDSQIALKTKRIVSRYSIRTVKYNDNRKGRTEYKAKNLGKRKSPKCSTSHDEISFTIDSQASEVTLDDLKNVSGKIESNTSKYICKKNLVFPGTQTSPRKSKNCRRKSSQFRKSVPKTNIPYSNSQNTLPCQFRASKLKSKNEHELDEFEIFQNEEESNLSVSFTGGSRNAESVEDSKNSICSEEIPLHLNENCFAKEETSVDIKECEYTQSFLPESECNVLSNIQSGKDNRSLPHRDSQSVTISQEDSLCLPSPSLPCGQKCSKIVKPSPEEQRSTEDFLKGFISQTPSLPATVKLIVEPHQPVTSMESKDKMNDDNPLSQNSVVKERDLAHFPSSNKTFSLTLGQRDTNAQSNSVRVKLEEMSNSPPQTSNMILSNRNNYCKEKNLTVFDLNGVPNLIDPLSTSFFNSADHSVEIVRSTSKPELFNVSVFESPFSGDNDQLTSNCDDSGRENFDQSDLEFIPNSQGVNTPNIVPDIQSLRNLSASTSKKCSLSSGEFIASNSVSEDSDVNSEFLNCFEKLSSMSQQKQVNEDPFQSSSKPENYPLTSTQYSQRHQRLPIPQVSPLTFQRREGEEVAPSTSFLSYEVNAPENGSQLMKNQEQLVNYSFTDSNLENATFHFSTSALNLPSQEISKDVLCDDSNYKSTSKNPLSSIKVNMAPMFASPSSFNLDHSLIRKYGNMNGNCEVERGQSEPTSHTTVSSTGNKNQSLQITCRDGCEESPHNIDESNQMDEINEQFEVNVSVIMKELKALFFKKRKSYAKKQMSTWFKIKMKEVVEGEIVEKSTFRFPLLKKVNQMTDSNFISFSMETVSDKGFKAPEPGAETRNTPEPSRAIDELKHNLDEENTHFQTELSHCKGTNYKTQIKQRSKLEPQREEAILKLKNKEKEEQERAKLTKLEVNSVLRNNWWEVYLEDIPEYVYDSNRSKTAPSKNKESGTSENIKQSKREKTIPNTQTGNGSKVNQFKIFEEKCSNEVISFTTAKATIESNTSHTTKSKRKLDSEFTNSKESAKKKANECTVVMDMTPPLPSHLKTTKKKKKKKKKTETEPMEMKEPPKLKISATKTTIHSKHIKNPYISLERIPNLDIFEIHNTQKSSGQDEIQKELKPIAECSKSVDNKDCSIIEIKKKKKKKKKDKDFHQSPLNEFREKKKLLTPPYHFKKMIGHPGRKRKLLNNCDFTSEFLADPPLLSTNP